MGAGREGKEGRGGRGLGWQNLAAIHDGGISTKIISPQATEGGGEGFLGGGAGKSDTERLGIVGLGEGVGVGDGEGGYKGGK